MASAKLVQILNVHLDNVSMTELLDNLESGVVFTPNVDYLIELQQNPDFLECYDVANYKICDSKIVEYVCNKN